MSGTPFGVPIDSLLGQELEHMRRSGTLPPDEDVAAHVASFWTEEHQRLFAVLERGSLPDGSGSAFDGDLLAAFGEPPKRPATVGTLFYDLHASGRLQRAERTGKLCGRTGNEGCSWTIRHVDRRTSA